MSSPLTVAVIGCGRAGMVHARNLAGCVRDVELLAVVDADADAAARAARELGCAHAWSDPVAAAQDERVDAVVIATPTFTHADIATAALAADTHVLCEKPLAATPDDGRRIAKAAAHADTVSLVGFMRRFDPAFRRAAERVAAGDIGEPVMVRSTTRGPGLPPSWAWDPDRSGGLIAEVNSHDLDTVRWFSGQELTRVHAVGRAAKRPDIQRDHPGFVDVVATTFELDGGAIAQVDGACPADYGYDARVEVYGTEGAVFAGDPRVGRELMVRADGAHADVVRSWRDVFAAAYREEDAHFVQAALGREAPRTSTTDGLRALEAVLAVNASLRSGAPTEVVRLDAEV